MFREHRTRVSRSLQRLHPGMGRIPARPRRSGARGVSAPGQGDHPRLGHARMPAIARAPALRQPWCAAQGIHAERLQRPDRPAPRRRRRARHDRAGRCRRPKARSALPSAASAVAGTPPYRGSDRAEVAFGERPREPARHRPSRVGIAAVRHRARAPGFRRNAGARVGNAAMSARLCDMLSRGGDSTHALSKEVARKNRVAAQDGRTALCGQRIALSADGRADSPSIAPRSQSIRRRSAVTTVQRRAQLAAAVGQIGRATESAARHPHPETHGLADREIGEPRRSKASPSGSPGRSRGCRRRQRRPARAARSCSSRDRRQRSCRNATSRPAPGQRARGAGSRRQR